MALQTTETERGKVSEYRDGAEYYDGEWFITFDWDDESEKVLTYRTHEREIDVEDLSGSKRRMYDHAGFIHDGVVHYARSEHYDIPKDIREELLEAGYSVVEWGRADGLPDREDWLYEGECPQCGPESVLIRSLGGADVCYDCGSEVPAND